MKPLRRHEHTPLPGMSCRWVSVSFIVFRGFAPEGALLCHTALHLTAREPPRGHATENKPQSPLFRGATSTFGTPRSHTN